MTPLEKESSIPSRILSYLKKYPDGVNIIDISANLGIGRNLVARHLTTLSQIGRLDLRTDGNNKIYRLAHRIPFHIFSVYSKLGAIGFNRSLLVQEVSVTALHILGCTESDLIGRWIEDLPYPLFQNLNISTLARRVLSGNISDPPEISSEIGEKILDISLSPCIFDDTTTGVVIIISDLSGKEKLLTKERLVSDRFDALMRETEEFIVDLDTDDRIIRINHGMARYFGRSPGDFIGLQGLPSLSLDDFQRVKRATYTEPIISDLTRLPVEVRVVMPDGKIRYQEWQAYSEEKNGIPWSLHCIGSDITEKIQQKARIHQYESEFSEMVDEKTIELQEVIKTQIHEINNLKRMEQTRYLNENRYQRLTETISEIIWETGEEHQFTFVSPKVQDYLGYAPELLIGKHFFEIIDDTIGQSRTFDFVSRLISGKPIDQMVTPIRSSDGSTHWLKISGVPYIGPDGIFYGYYGIANDITEQVLDEEQKSELLSIIESTPHIISITREDGTISYLNQTGKKFFGILNQSDCNQTSVFSFIPKSDIQDYIAKRAEAVEAGFWMGDTIMVSGDGTPVPMYQIIQYHRHEPSKKSYFSTIFRDISDRLAFEQELATAYEYSRMLTEVNPDLIATFSIDGKILDVNSAVEQVTGYSRQNLIGTEYFQFFSDPERMRAVHKQVLAKGTVIQYMNEIIHQTGKKTPVIGSSVVFRDQSGNIKGILGSAKVVPQSDEGTAHEKEHRKRSQKPPPE